MNNCCKIHFKFIKCTNRYLGYLLACYKGPFPPVCPLPCFSACAPRCYFSCCQQYHLNYYAILPPPHNIHRAPCPEGCPITCAPFGCTTHCCHSLPHYEYGKRHQAPKLGSNRKLATSSIDIIRRIKRKKKKLGAKRIKETNSSEKNFWFFANFIWWKVYQANTIFPEQRFR